MPATYEPIATESLSSNQANITFSAIPSTFTDLVLVFRGGMATTTGYGLTVRVNGDSGNNYGWTRLYGAGANAVTSDSATPQSWFLGLIAGANNLLSIHTMTFQNYKDTSFHKTMTMESYGAGWTGGGATGILGVSKGIWRNTAAITSIAFSPEFTANLLSGSTATLYGIKRA
jgi:hypothetical protein